jgi:acetoin:2,6-dichlorophenolindophenol oxidoreductase subunit beta
VTDTSTTTALAVEPPAGERNLSTAKAMQEAIAQAMRRDDSVFVIGEDVAAYGGIFASTSGLLDEFGDERVRDTPISETAFIGLGIGAAVEGMRPIVELMFVDFFGVCMDQIYNHMAKIHFESGGNVRVPMVLMTATGAGYSDGTQHSQSLWGTFAHLPGMKVVVPASPYDAKGLMAAAIQSDDPVVFMFHKGAQGLAWMAKNPRSIGPVPEEEYIVPIGKARVAREGKDVSIVTLSLSVQHSLDVAEKLAAEGIDVEVIDLRTVKPLDRATIAASVAKTGKLIVVDEDYQSFGVSGEVIASVVEAGVTMSHVDRVCVPDVPIPFARELEHAVLPSPARIEAAVRKAVGR